MTGRWIDFAVAVVLIFSLARGFRRGLIREIFGLFGAILAVAVAYEWYQELSIYLMDAFPLELWQAQIIAFVALVSMIALVAGFFGFVWSRAIRLTPFALLDNLAGAGFGAAKVIIVVAVLVALLSSLGADSVNEMLGQSVFAARVQTYLPDFFLRLEQIWPADWPKPGWLFPTDNVKTGESTPQTPLVASGVWLIT